MELLSFRIENFRIIDKIDWIKLDKLMIMTGENDGGKTTTIEALKFLLTTDTPDDKDFRRIGEFISVEEISVFGIFKLNTKDKEDSGLEHFDKDKITIKKSIRKGQKSQYHYYTKVPKDQKYKDLDLKSFDEIKQLAKELSVPTKGKKSEIISEIIKTLPLIDGWSILPIQLTRNFPTITIFSSSNSSDLIGEIGETIRGNFRQYFEDDAYKKKLGEITEEIHQKTKNDLLLLKSIVLKYCPDLRDLEIQPQFDFIRGFLNPEISIRKNNSEKMEFALSKEGDGRKRKMTLAIYEWRKDLLSKSIGNDFQRIVCFDEPDVHLDYNSQRKIFENIKVISESKGNIVMISTHALNLIDRLPLSNILHFSIDMNNHSSCINRINCENFQELDDFLYQLGDSMGLRNSTILFERCFLVVEGSTEMGALPVLFNKYFNYPLQSAGIKLMNGEGFAGGLRFIKELTRSRKKVIFMVDSDAKISLNGYHFSAENLQANGITDSDVHYMGSKEFEDLFSDAIYLRTAQTHWKTGNDSNWQIEDFQSLRSSQKFSEELKNLIWKRTRNSKSKIEIGIDIAQCINKEEIPKAILDCFKQTLDLANPTF